MAASTTHTRARVADVEEGATYALVGVDVRAGQTTPPPYLSESDLITLMEKHGSFRCFFFFFMMGICVGVW